MADATPAQRRLDEHVKMCSSCGTAKEIGQCCPVGQILAKLVHSISTR
jgi:hypothetical protein